MQVLLIALVFLLGALVAERITYGSEVAEWRRQVAVLLWPAWLVSYGLLYLLFEVGVEG